MKLKAMVSRLAKCTGENGRGECLFRALTCKVQVSGLGQDLLDGDKEMETIIVLGILLKTSSFLDES